MPLLWTLPPVAVALAMLIMLTQMRHISRATVALREEFQRVDEVRTAAAELRVATAEMLQTMRTRRGS